MEEFIIDIHVPSLLPFLVKEFTDYRFQIGIWNGDSFRADLAAESALIIGFKSVYGMEIALGPIWLPSLL